ncbi:DUF4097 family beta strand repeat-containing protein [Amycolatopsis sp. NPDC051071]|uniref:DUF4097 family beta strand repeat-containing protein n=1 Tax=Amycolatopsis sp. NPDC051071 TaxID=3154637 RepID=UPI003428E4E2
MPSFTTPNPITATLTTAGAKVRIAASERSDTVVRVEPLDGTNKTDVKVAEKTKVDFTDGELSIKTTKSGDKNGSVAITIEVPAGSGLVLNTGWTDVHAYGPLGDCELNTSSGQVQIDRVTALRGNLAAGGIAIGHVAGDVAIEGGTAGVRIGEVEGTVRYSGSSAQVWIGRARSVLALESSGGAFDIDRADDDVTVKTGDSPIRIGRLTRGLADLTNAAGGIEVGISDGSTASVDAKSTKGTVRNSLSAQHQPGESGAAVKVIARTRLDDIVIHRVAS